MKIKITIEVMKDSGGSVNMGEIEANKIMINAVNGVMKKYEGRVSTIVDSFSSSGSWWGQTTKVKEMSILDEEEKKEA